MLRLGRSKIPSLRPLSPGGSLSLRLNRCLLSSLNSSFSTSSTTNQLSPRRASLMADPASLVPDMESLTVKADSNPLFNYTSGEWLSNSDRRHKERYRKFDVPGLRRLIAKSVGRKDEDITKFEKLGEGGLNRAFLISFNDFQLVARIPYPVMVPKAHGIASEVATMRFLRLQGLPVPEVYDYSFTSDNEAKTEYILMEYIRSASLSKIWYKLKESEIISLMDQLAHLEATMMSISFPASGSLYHVDDLKQLSGDTGILLNDKSFCVGPDVSSTLWYGRREHLRVYRGPYEDVQSALVGPAHKELAYLEEFGKPLLPFNRLRREHYKYEKQSPSDHINNLQRYLRIVSSIIPKDDPSLCDFRIRHPDLKEDNIKVSMESGVLRIISLFDWQHAAILPFFVHACIPDSIQNYGDEVSDHLGTPSLPDNFAHLSDEEKARVTELHRRRLIHHHYVMSTKAHNRLHYDALVYSMNAARRRLFKYAGAKWDGDPIYLLLELVDAMRQWEHISEGRTPCLIDIPNDEAQKAIDLDEALKGVAESEKLLGQLLGIGDETWLPLDRYEKSKKVAQKLKEMSLAEIGSEGERARVEENWFLDDMDEDDYE